MDFAPFKSTLAGCTPEIVLEKGFKDIVAQLEIKQETPVRNNNIASLFIKNILPTNDSNPDKTQAAKTEFFKF